MTRALLAALALLATSQVQALGSTTCHIHPPGSTPEEPVGTIGPFDSVRACEEERAQRFGAQGYCHCSADFTPDWRRLEPASPTLPGDPLI